MERDDQTADFENLLIILKNWMDRVKQCLSLRFLIILMFRFGLLCRYLKILKEQCVTISLHDYYDAKYN